MILNSGNNYFQWSGPAWNDPCLLNNYGQQPIMNQAPMNRTTDNRRSSAENRNGDTGRSSRDRNRDNRRSSRDRNRGSRSSSQNRRNRDQELIREILDRFL